jgi:acetyl-CoA carboxylase biotin carboxyl carrier protein
VAKESNGTPRPFDTKTVEHLIKLMADHDLAEISLQEGNERIRLRKGRLLTTSALPAAGPIPSAPVQSPAPAPTPTAPAPVAVSTKKLLEIKSEMVGTFYAKPKPDKPDYVSVGTKVKADTIICQIEAMKIFNEVPAGLAGTIVEVCVKNAEPVEFGTVLFRVDPS